MFWKVYFFLYLAIMTIGASATHAAASPTPLQLVLYILTIPTTIGALFAYAFGWPRLPRLSWRILLSATAAGTAMSLVLFFQRLPVFTGRYGGLVYPVDAALLLLPLVPVFYAMTKSACGRSPAVSS